MAQTGTGSTGQERYTETSRLHKQGSRSGAMYENRPVTSYIHSTAFPSWFPKTFKLAPTEERSGVSDFAFPLNSEAGHGIAHRSLKELVLESKAFQAPTDERSGAPDIITCYL